MRYFSRPAVGVLLAALLYSAPALSVQEAGSSADSIKIYDPADLNLSRYEILKRLWVGSWRSAFDVPRHADAGAAVAEMKITAAKLGADGLMNVVCVPEEDWWLRKASFFCHALAIRLKK